MSSIYLADVVAAVACIISVILGVQLLRDFFSKRKEQQLWWALSMFLYAISSFEEFYAPMFGWTSFGYKLYYFCAISLVSVMAMGQMYMSFSKKVAGYYRVGSIVFLLLFFIFLVREPLVQSALQDATGTLAGSGMAPKSIPRIVFAPLLDGIGGILLIVLPFISWWRTSYRTPLFVGIGAIVLSLAGMVTHWGLSSILPLAELVGIVIIYYGVITDSRATPVSQQASLNQ